MFPFPNNFWLRGNGSAPARVQLGNATLPLDRTGKPIRADYGGWNSLDGTSHHTQACVHPTRPRC